MSRIWLQNKSENGQFIHGFFRKEFETFPRWEVRDHIQKNVENFLKLSNMLYFQVNIIVKENKTLLLTKKKKSLGSKNLLQETKIES